MSTIYLNQNNGKSLESLTSDALDFHRLISQKPNGEKLLSHLITRILGFMKCETGMLFQFNENFDIDEISDYKMPSTVKNLISKEFKEKHSWFTELCLDTNFKSLRLNELLEAGFNKGESINLIPIHNFGDLRGLLVLTSPVEVSLNLWQENLVELVSCVLAKDFLSNTSMNKIDNLQNELGKIGSTNEIKSLGLNSKQQRIAEMIVQGMTNSEISKIMGYSEATIRYETIKLYERLRVKNRSQAAAKVRELLV